MANPGFIKNFDAASEIGTYRIVAMFNVDFTVQQAANVAMPIVGVSEHGSTDNGRCDVVMSQTGVVEYGGDVKTGDVLVADAQGRAIKFDKAGHADDDIIWALGTALEDGDEGTIGTATVNPFMIVK